MEARAKILGHPVHQMLIPFPLGLLATSFFFDVAWLIFRRAELASVAWWMIIAGVITALAAALFGLVDYTAIPKGTRAKRIGAMHGIGNVIVVLLFAGSWLLRRDEPLLPDAGAITLSAAGVTLALLTAWLGGELVDRLGVGVDDGAHLNAPNSLSGRPAHEGKVPH